jgi:hypothetical protein
MPELRTFSLLLLGYCEWFFASQIDLLFVRNILILVDFETGIELYLRGGFLIECSETLRPGITFGLETHSELIFDRDVFSARRKLLRSQALPL